MTTLDIRNYSKETITEIRFDSTLDILVDNNNKGTVLAIKSRDGELRDLCNYNDLDNFILACQKAKELWHKTDWQLKTD